MRGYSINQVRVVSTVEVVIIHTPRWTVQAIGYYRSWVATGMLKIDSKITKKESIKY